MSLKTVQISSPFDTRVAASGLCERCGVKHSMVLGYSVPFAKELFQTITEAGRIDFDVPESEADPRLSTRYLFGPARGQMFGVLVVRDMDGRTGVLKAFSGQYNGVWDVDGWVPPLIDADEFWSATTGVERLIKRLSRKIDSLPGGSHERKQLVERRKAYSQALMKDIHNMYMIPDFCGKVTPLPQVVTEGNGIPTGTGDCCAPKLLGYAARNSLTPLGLAEFYFGKENRSKTKKHGGMYVSCKDKCGRIIGHMLCGACEV
ncbi:hypothetical protein [Pseudodesulfovibrio sp. zrk46]|uniref:hypothetical protein n=1 Tax=Pseudodesulfovibrio sp. zrk46 TaxID=2725288 RepID=UPI001448DC5E|nr:hypothetical protein [Pseudodesulfovibrio sp. zrk46]QJB55361.1 hypothetical protein HFN16_02670 [Pseudodesulfovibrio sp. zrk46]